MTQQEFDDVYWLSFADEVQVLRGMQNNDPAKGKLLTTLASRYLLSCAIHGLNCSPFIYLTLLKDLGAKWFFAYDYNQEAMEMVPNPLGPRDWGFDTPMPSYGIKVSLDLKDYPPFNPPTPPDNTLVANPVGVVNPFNPQFYCSAWADNWPVGSTYTDARGTFVKMGVPTPFGPRTYWEKK